jgi:ankyrin repeat protein
LIQIKISKSFYLFSYLNLLLSPFLILCLSLTFGVLGCGQHDIKNFGYTRQVTAEVAEAAVTWQDRFEEAINQNKNDEIESLLAEDSNVPGLEPVDFTVLLKNGRTPLTHAVVSGSAIVVYWLLQKNVDVTAIDGLGKTAMDYAIELNKERVKLLLDSNLQIQLQDEFYNAILADGEDVAILVKSYLEAGVNPNFVYEQTGETPLTQAIKIKSIAVIQIIRWTDKELGLTATDLNLPNQELKTPLTVAQEINFKKVVKALEELNAQM